MQIVHAVCCFNQNKSSICSFALQLKYFEHIISSQWQKKTSTSKSHLHELWNVKNVKLFKDTFSSFNRKTKSSLKQMKRFYCVLTPGSKGTFKHPIKPQSPRFHAIHKTFWNLGSKRSCLKVRTGWSVDFPTEFLSCLRSIQRSRSIRVKSPMSIPMYKLRFQPQPTASGSDVDATLNLLGTGMEADGNPTLPPLEGFFL